MGEIQRGEQTQQQVAEVSPDSVFARTGVVGVSEETIDFGAYSTSILVKNTHATQSLYVYFRSSPTAWNTSYFTISTGDTLSIDHRAKDIKLKGSGVNTGYEILVTLE